MLEKLDDTTLILIHYVFSVLFYPLFWFFSFLLNIYAPLIVLTVFTVQNIVFWGLAIMIAKRPL